MQMISKFKVRVSLKAKPKLIRIEETRSLIRTVAKSLEEVLQYNVSEHVVVLYAVVLLLYVNVVVADYFVPVVVVTVVVPVKIEVPIVMRIDGTGEEWMKASK